MLSYNYHLTLVYFVFLMKDNYLNDIKIFLFSFLFIFTVVIMNFMYFFSTNNNFYYMFIFYRCGIF